MVYGTVKHRMSLGFAVSLILMIVLVMEGLTSMAAIQQRLKQIVENHNVKTELVTAMRNAARERTIALYRMVTLEDPFERDEQFLEFNHFAAEFANARLAYMAMVLTEQEKAIFAKQASLTSAAVSLQEQVVDLALRGETAAAIKLLYKKTVPAQDQVFEQLTELNDIQREAAQVAVMESTTAYESARLWMLYLCVAALMAGTIVAIVVSRFTVRAEMNLFREKERALVTLHSIGEGVITTNLKLEIVYMNPVAEEITGWTQSEVVGKNLDEVFRILDENGEQLAEDPVQQAMQESRVIRLERPCQFQRRDGADYAIEITTASLPDYNGSTAGAVITFRNVTALRDMAEQMAYQASHDVLTGLINRREFELRLESALVSAHALNKQHILCYLDLDQFKIVNDTCGHMAGDELLRQLAMLIHGKVRMSDSFGRLGGDEFGLLLLDCPLNKGLDAIEAILEVIRDFRFYWCDKSFEIGASAGVVPLVEESGTMSDIMSAADSACYVAKELGRNRIHVYQDDDEVLSQRHGEMQWMQRIKHALENDKFVLFYQRIHALADNSLHSCELLLRMLDDDDNVISPATFLPAAERYGLMPMLDRWVVRNALRIMSEGRLAEELRDVQWAINLSGQSLGDADFLDYIITCIQESGVEPGRICFEITETAAVANLSYATRMIQALKVKGCRFALDDFGSGLSSFTYLRNLPVDFLKIDGSFVRHMAADRMDCAMVESINQIGHVLGLQTIAEYAEDDDVLSWLRSLGVDYAQGYRIHRPEPLQPVQRLQAADQLLADG